MKNLAFALGGLLVLVSACSSGSPATPTPPAAPSVGAATQPSSPVVGYAIGAASGAPLAAVAGDALRLVVLQKHADGSTAPLDATVSVTWSGPPLIHALPEDADPSDSILPQAGVAATGMWLSNPEHYSDADLDGVLWALDPGSAPNPGLHVTAAFGVDPPVYVDATIPVGGTPPGDATRGAVTYAKNCASCHGATGHGTPDYPGLNAEPGNVAGDPAWNAALLAMSARSDMDNMGLSLGEAMPKWLVRPTAGGKPPTTQEFADIYAFLQTQTQ
jgi:mono/diheme cytochrome c family protein